MNTLAVPVLVVAITGSAPFILNVVAVVPVITGLPIVNVPVEAPIPSVVAAPAKLTVVAVALIKLKVVLPVVKLVVIAGLVPNTKTPLPVSSLITPASSADVVAENALNLLLVYVTVPPSPNATDGVAEVSVLVNVTLLLAVSVFPSAIVKVDPVAGVVIATLLIVVAVATPSAGVTNVGLVSNTNLLVPVAPVLVTPSIVG